jgi:hypothetical protein
LRLKMVHITRTPQSCTFEDASVFINSDHRIAFPTE